MHEYSVIGHSRASIGRYLGVLAGILAATAAVVAAALLELAQALGLSGKASGIVIFPLNAALFYFLGHLIFDKWVWKQKLVSKLLGIPDLGGEWECIGQTKDDQGNVVVNWTATVRITQTWEKIWVYLDTGQSRSRSKSASLVKEPGRGYILMYSYQNEPRIGEPELKTHVGYCELEINEDVQTAEGDYFNNKGRITFGRMQLKRKENANG